MASAHRTTRTDNPLPILKSGSEYPAFIRSMENHLLKLQARALLMLPDLRQSVNGIGIFTDYGGESHGAKYLTYSFLFVAFDALPAICRQMRRLREQFKLAEPFKEIAFKDLHHGPLSNCLSEWLRMGDHVLGLLVTLVVDKRAESIIHGTTRATSRQVADLLRDQGLGVRKDKVAEKTVRIIHTIAYFCAFLSKPGQKIFWMTDKDDIVANDSLAKGSMDLLARVLHIYRPSGYELIGTAQQFDELDREFNLNDMLSFADLAAGAVAAYYSEQDFPEGSPTRQGATEILRWLGHQSLALKKLTFSFEPGPSQGLNSSTVQFKAIPGAGTINSGTA